MHRISSRKLVMLVVVACCLLFAGTAFSQTAPFGYLDSAADKNGNTTLPATAILVVNGWAADTNDLAPVTKVEVLVDGKVVATATLGLQRPDVAAALGNSGYLPSGWTANVSLANLKAGPHTITAVAYNSVPASTVLAGQKTITIVAPDLSASDVAVSGTPVAGKTLQISEKTSNIGALSAGWSLTRFYLNTTAVRGGKLLGSRQVAALAAGAVSGPVATTVTLPAGVGGTYYLVACANDTSTVADGNPSNNCSASTPITVAGVDLAETVSVPATGIAGTTIQITDILTNQGVGAASFSVTRFYLNRTATKGGILLGSRSVSSLGAGASSGPVNTTVTLPASAGGKYYVLACANDTNTVADSNPANNCGSAPITVSGADLATAITATSAAVSGGNVQVSDVVTNQGLGSAGWSITRFYINTTPVRGGTLLGSRSVASLAPGAVSSGKTTVKLASGLAEGQYYIVACANDTNTVSEANTANNCATSTIDVYLAANTVVVDPANVADPYDAAVCGTAAAPCNSITDGLNAAKAGKTVLTYPGTYVEQITITKDINLVSAEKHQAVIQAPADAELVPDANNHQTLVTVTGGATNVTVKNLTVAGPMVADSCVDNIYGIFVKNANANIIGNKVDAIRQANPDLWGCQPGVGIRFGSRALGYTGHSGTLSNNLITGPAKAGIVVDGDNNNVNVTGNTITGLSLIGVIGQNGIQISRGAKGTLDSNKISGCWYGSTFSSIAAAGILLYDPDGGLTLTNNEVTDNDQGIVISHSPKRLANNAPDFSFQFQTNVVLKKNKVTNNRFLGIHIDPFSSGNTIWNNIVTGNPNWDELDEHPDFNSNNWGTDPSNFNTIGTAHAGLVFSY